MELFTGNGWQMQIAGVYINLKSELFFKCRFDNCGAKCETLDELKHHVQSKHSSMRNEVAARVQNRRESLALSQPSMLYARFHGGNEFNLFTPPPPQPPPPPPPPSTSVAGQSDARNNANSIGTPAPAAASSHHSSESNISKLKFVRKVEVRKVEQHHLRFRYNCTVCRNVFGNRSELERHMAKCLSKKIRCDICRDPFESMQNKQRHERTIHADIFKYPCKECVQAFKRHQELVNHRQRHTNPSIKCDFCPKMLCTKFGKENHIKKEHSNRRYHCSVCSDYSSVSGKTMRKHYLDKHGGVPKSGI